MCCCKCTCCKCVPPPQRSLPYPVLESLKEIDKEGIRNYERSLMKAILLLEEGMKDFGQNPTTDSYWQIVEVTAELYKMGFVELTIPFVRRLAKEYKRGWRVPESFDTFKSFLQKVGIETLDKNRSWEEAGWSMKSK